MSTTIFDLRIVSIGHGDHDNWGLPKGVDPRVFPRKKRGG